MTVVTNGWQLQGPGTLLNITKCVARDHGGGLCPGTDVSPLSLISGGIVEIGGYHGTPQCMIMAML